MLSQESVKRFVSELLEPQYRLRLLTTAAILVWLPVVGNLAVFWMVLVALHDGQKISLPLFAAITLPLALLAAFYEMRLYFLVGIWTNCLLWYFANLLHKRYPWQQLIKIGFYTACLTVVCVHLIFPDIQEHWLKILTPLFQNTNTNPLKLPPIPADKATIFIRAFAQTMTGGLVGFMLMIVLLTLLGVRFIQAWLFNPGGLKKELSVLQMRSTEAFVTVAIAVLAAFNISYFRDLIGIPIVCYAFTGVVVMHHLVSRLDRYKLWLWLIYPLSLIFMNDTILLFALLGYFDTWLNLRNKILIEHEKG